MRGGTPHNRDARESGHSLVEILVALVASALLIVVVYRVFRYFQEQSLVQRRISQEQARMVPAQLNLEKNLRRAGYGIPLQSRMRISASVTQPRPAVEILTNVSGPDDLILRGNFTDTRSQLTQPLTVSSSAYLNLLKGTAGAFAAGDVVVLARIDSSEYVTVSSVDAGNHRLLASTRLSVYPAGTTVNKVVEIRYQYQAPDSSLRLLQTAGTSVVLPKVADLKFHMKLANGYVQTAPPFSPDSARSILYTLTVRIPKTKGQYLVRNVAGKVLLRNSLL